MVYLVIALSILLDQLTKWFATLYLADSIPLWNGVFHLTFATNTGAAWGMLKDHRWIFMTISTLAIVAILAYLIFVKEQSKGSRLALALICGGGIGNMIDRIALGYVVDFLDFRLINFPIFNLADSCVCVGTFLFLFFFLKEEWDAERKKKAENE